MFRRLLSVGVVAVVVGFLAAPRAEAVPDPGAFIGTIGTQGISMLGPNVPAGQRLARFKQIFQSDFDVPGIARFVLGRYWRAYTPEQQQEFMRLFQDYTVVAYSDRLSQYGGAQFTATGVQNNGDEIIVASQVTRPSGNPVEMDWHLMPAGDSYKITDILVDRVSMKVTQRDEFAKIIQNNGGNPDALLAVLRQQLREHQQNQKTVAH
jgi:phospholipid transport system substrate-binding protein